MKESKSQQTEQSKEEALQGLSYATASMINSRLFPRNNAMGSLNGASPRIMEVR